MVKHSCRNTKSVLIVVDFQLIFKFPLLYFFGIFLSHCSNTETCSSSVSVKTDVLPGRRLGYFIDVSLQTQVLFDRFICVLCF